MSANACAQSTQCGKRDLQDRREPSGPWGHGWAWVLPEDVANMTDAPMLTDDGRYDPVSRTLKVWGSLWWYSDHRACDLVDLLLTRGAVTFQALVLR